MANSFVYEWNDTLTGMKYIGVHKGAPDDGYVCSSKAMLPIYRERPETFQREILGIFDEYQRAREYEIKLLTELDATNNPLYYNLNNGTGMDPSAPKSPEHRRKISMAHKGKVFDPIVQEKCLAAIRGKPLSEEHKRKIGLGGKGRKCSEETKEKMSHVNLGKKLSEEHKEKIRQSKLGKPSWNKGIKRKPEWNEKQSITMKNIYLMKK
jgi:hypothetical protein